MSSQKPSKSSSKTSEEAVPKYKHQKDISKYASKDCPPSDATKKEMDAYRGVSSSLSSTDFKTYINLGKVPRATESIHFCCMRCGLSMYVKKEDMKNAYKKWLKKETFPYSHIAKGTLLEEDGMCTVPKSDGHFTLHEFEGVDLLKRFSIVETIAA